MPKKKTSSPLKKLPRAGDKPATVQTKPVPKPGKLGKEIDNIFGVRKKKKPELETTEKKEIDALQQTKPVPKPGKLGKEIDDIFGGRKKKKPELDTTEKKETPMKTEMTKKKRKRKRSELDGFSNNPQNRPRKRTEDGLLVFTEDELGISKANAGYTNLCPFDCQCCF